MKTYLVGGSVRDELLGLPIKDHDYVVVGSTPEEMTRLGYRPVGKDFPVFLHPQSHEQYALARTDRKIGFCHQTGHVLRLHMACESILSAEAFNVFSKRMLSSDDDVRLPCPRR